MGKHFTEWQRYKLETMLEDKVPVAQIAKRLGKCRQTIYNEIKRGTVMQRDSEYRDILVYKADYAQNDFKSKQSAKGPAYKIGKDWQLYDFIQDKLVNEKWSPLAIIGYLRLNQLQFSCTLCFRTIYNYIHAGLFLEYPESKLLKYKKEKKKKYAGVPKKNVKGTSIEDRPDLSDREEFGHWEMDCVIGKREKEPVLLVLTERMSRFEIIRKIADKTQKSVISAVDSLEQLLGDSFKSVFKSITMDNGTEFLDFKSIESSSIVSGETRTQTFYCHPFASWERGSNECANKMIRRWIPKGSPIENYTDGYIKAISSWMNNYPRKIFDFLSSSSIVRSVCPKYSEKLINLC